MSVIDFQDHLLATFREEAVGYVESFTAGLLALEQGLPSAERHNLLDELYRQAHSLKGAAQVTGLMATRDLAHDMENALDAMRHSEDAPEPIAFDPLYRLIDSIGRSVKADVTPPVIEPAAETPAETLDTVDAVLVPLSPDPTPSTDTMRTIETVQNANSIRVTTVKLDALFDSTQELLLATRRTDRWIGTLNNLYAMVRDWQRSETLGMFHNTFRKGSNAYQDTAVLPTVNRLAMLEQQVTEILSNAEQDTNAMHRVVGTLQKRVMETRMQPAETLITVLRRAMRDLSSQTGKAAGFNVEGEQIEVDRFVLEMLRDPLIHVLRNAVDHGIESAEVRRRVGKAETGTVALRLSVSGNYLRVEVSDDGAGMSLGDLRAAALRNGLMSADEAAHATMQQLVGLATTAGFSTRSEVSDLSGRGLGLNIVQRQVEALHGSLDIHTTPGMGTRLVMQVPLTLLTIDALIASVGGQTLAIPLTAVSRALRVQADSLLNLNGRPALASAEGPLPVFSLATLLDLPGSVPTEGPIVLLLTSGSRVVALHIDSLESQQPVVVRQFGYPLRRVRNLSGATLLDDGQPAVILNMVDVLKTAERRGAPIAITPIVSQPKVQRILVVDDSITTRTLEKQILEHMGYAVAIAVNGREALELARREVHDAPFDLVISDLMMPMMNGYELTAAIRADKTLETLPVVLVTSMDSPEDRRQGMEAGADAYVVKGQFDQDQLLETIRRLIG